MDDFQSETQIGKRYRVSKPLQDKKTLHVARMPDNFKAFPPKYLHTRKGDAAERNFKERKIALKKVKLNNENAKSTVDQFQYMMEDLDDMVERENKQDIARYNGVESKGDSKNTYLLIRVDETIRMIPITSLIAFKKDMKLESRSLDEFKKRKRKGGKEKEEKEKKNKADEDSELSVDSDEKKSVASDASLDLKEFMEPDADDTGPKNVVEPVKKKVVEKPIPAATPIGKGKPIPVTQPAVDNKSIITDDASESLADNDGLSGSDMSFEDL